MHLPKRVNSSRPGAFKKSVYRTFVLFGLLSVIQVHASENSGIYFMTGGTLVEHCQKTSDFEMGRCLGYVQSMVDMHDTLVAWGRLEKRWCIPADVSGDQLVEAALDGLRAQPELSDHAAASLLDHSFISAFPCEHSELQPPAPDRVNRFYVR